MKIIYFIAFILLLSSCKMGQNFCEKNYPTHTVDSVIVVHDIVHDTIWYPYEGISFDTTGFIDTAIVFHHEEKKGTLKSTISIKKGKITFKCEVDSLNNFIAFQKRIITKSNHRTKLVQMPCDKKHKTGWNSFCTYFFWIAFAIISVRLALKYFTGK